jgi:hypothetical protein
MSSVSANDKARLRAQLRRMRSWHPANEYYAITLTVTRDGQPKWSLQSNFAGPSDRYRGWEKREASLVYPDKMAAVWEGIGQSWLAVDDRVALGLWIRLGGNGLVEAELACEHLPWMVGSREVAPDGPTGFLTPESLSPGQRARRTSRARRNEVSERDGHVCRRCGRGQPAVRLTRHHVLAREDGGLTQVNNLVTLCDDCHDALHADSAWPPASDLQGVVLSDAINRLDGEDHDEAVARHREMVASWRRSERA